MPNSKIITIKLSQSQAYLAGAVVIAVCLTLGFFYVRAAFIEPTFAPGDSDQDFAQNILGANNADNEFNSYLVAGNSEGSIIERLESLQDDYTSSFFSGISIPQQFQVYDDWNCNGANFTGNNGTSTAACSWSDPEYTGEEGTWASTTDTNISTQYIVSGMVFRDQRTGLYWSDAFDETAGGNGTEDDIENDFGIASTSGACSGAGAGGNGCTPEEINAGACDSSKYFCYNQDGTTSGVNWSALDWCLNLSLDADGDGTDETDWRLPTQKELMTAYINGAANILPHPARGYWSSTEDYFDATFAWSVYLADGNTFSNFKTVTGYYARCVRR